MPTGVPTMTAWVPAPSSISRLTRII
jgi:hypothetical protein